MDEVGRNGRNDGLRLHVYTGAEPLGMFENRRCCMAL